MKRFISVLLCAFVLFSAFSFSALGAKEESETIETTELLLEIDVNKRYTNFANDIGDVEESDDSEEKKLDEKTQIYIAILSAALVVSVVVLVVSLKKVPKEEDIDISREEKNKEKTKRKKSL